MNTGKVFAQGTAKFNKTQIINQIWHEFQKYKEAIYDEPDYSNAWFGFLDVLGVVWNFYGDYDYNIDRYEEKLRTTLLSLNTKTRQELTDWLQDIGDQYDNYRNHLKETYTEENGWHTIQM